MTEAHPAAALFPLLSDAEISALARDIAENGQRHPVVLWRGLILDGRNRSRACESIGRKPETVDMSDLSERDAVRFVISANIHRRHLTESQRAMIANELAKLGHGGDRSKPPIGGLTQAEAATALHTSERSVQRARAVASAGKDLADRVIAGEISVNKAAEIAKNRKRKMETDPNLADDSVVDATEQRHAEGDTPKARAVLAAVARLDPTELSFIKSDLLRILGAA